MRENSRKQVQKIIDNNENVMNAFLSSSIGLWLYNLSIKYKLEAIVSQNKVIETICHYI